jgi:hypothetical protein
LTAIDSTGTSVSMSGTGTATLTQTTGTETAWTNYTARFTASEATTVTLTFADNVSNGWGTYLDAVSVTATPEPSSLTILFIGLVGLLAYAWRKRK